MKKKRINQSEFYSSLKNSKLRKRFAVIDSKIQASHNLFQAESWCWIFNPVTALAFDKLREFFSNDKQDTLKAASMIGLDKKFAAQVYDASKCVTNRGNAQVVRGKLKKALGV